MARQALPKINRGISNRSTKSCNNCGCAHAGAQERVAPDNPVLQPLAQPRRPGLVDGREQQTVWNTQFHAFVVYEDISAK
ncbi:hypothetical protein DPMN_043005 [Dreissena polymorpha]|uniref:Uncharacterized protein n=1 Tax=Dreissena polymorpha TaxID=45954 RepID=A0A9D4D052_DREPO|nr:hypothetical protein DPMN_043005 [Dreissena polymorpha]